MVKAATESLMTQQPLYLTSQHTHPSLSGLTKHTISCSHVSSSHFAVTIQASKVLISLLLCILPHMASAPLVFSEGFLDSQNAFLYMRIWTKKHGIFTHYFSLRRLTEKHAFIHITTSCTISPLCTAASACPRSTYRQPTTHTLTHTH